ncbi:PAS domain-containing sensor histidine kinase [Ascidiimonas aurantiaca]|uniref:PAS domain-containing sensor histidine kinase n=1 Tax=Ascidiimonas aurantiaca TaxID=1685432 RepID=UPI0030EDE2EA
MFKELTLKSLSEVLDFHYWTLDKSDLQESWSEGFFSVFGYEEMNLSLTDFAKNFVHENDVQIILENFRDYIKYDLPFQLEIRVKTFNNQYHWLLCKTDTSTEQLINSDSFFIVFQDINDKKKYQIRYEENKFFYQESAEMTRTGGWFIDFVHQKTYWDRGVRKILELKKSTPPTVKKGLEHITKNYYFYTLRHFIACTLGHAFRIQIRMSTSKNRHFWAVIIGKPVFNEKQHLIGIRGVIQDIDTLKLKELHLQDSMDIIATQNARLFNFAHIVSHNLRSHSSNLQLVTELINQATDEKEKNELLHTVTQISNSLNITIEHLNEVAAIHTQINKKPKKISFEKTLQVVTASINQIITQEKATIEADFSEARTINYIPAYLESILLNLITNAIKYKHPKRDPIIKIQTRKTKDRVSMTITDNGIGIDLKLFGTKIFGMYKTFHSKKDAVGIGLFITKNQIESLNGTIEVTSEVNQGSCFKINF